VTLENLWAGWRHEYIQEATARERAHGAPDGASSDSASSDGVSSGGVSCVFCRLAESGPPSIENLVVWRGEWTFVVLNAYPYASGHVLVLPLRHAGGLGELTEPEAAEMWTATRVATVAIEKAYDPDGMNMGANLGRAAGAGIPSHVHIHVLPRWSGDTNFMTSIAGTRVMPETLQQAWKKLSEAWPEG
jgi:ATP adenylyltransferase